MPSASYNSGSPSSSGSNPSSSPVPPTTATGAGENAVGDSAPPNSASQSSPSNQSSLVAGEKDKPRLTEQEKKTNHIASEQKRRAAIREGFDRLTELVPGLEGQGRSESVVLRKSVDFMRMKLQERRDLVAEIETQGGRIDENMRR